MWLVTISEQPAESELLALSLPELLHEVLLAKGANDGDRSEPTRAEAQPGSHHLISASASSFIHETWLFKFFILLLAFQTRFIKHSVFL